MEVLQDKVAVITGAASGIGRALALALAEKGCHLALVDIDQVELVRSAELVSNRFNRNVSTHVCDVSQRAEIARLPDMIEREHGAIHLLFNNAGVTMTRSFEDSTLEDIDFVLGIDLWGVVYGCHYFLPYLKKQQQAHIVNTSSLAAYMGMPTQGSYCVAKAGVKALSETLRVELAHHNIGVTSIHPGSIRTNILRSAAAREETVPVVTTRLVEMMDRFAMPPEKLARKVVKAVQRNRMQVRIGIDCYMGDWLKRLFPIAVHIPLRWGFEKSLGRN